MSTGGGGLEVYGDGSGSPLLVDLHSCLRPWYGAHYSAGAVALRHDASHRHSVFQDREEENEDDDDGSRRGLKIPDTERNIVTRYFIKSEVLDCSGTKYTDSPRELARTLNHSSILYYFLRSVNVVVGKMKYVVYGGRKQILFEVLLESLTIKCTAVDSERTQDTTTARYMPHCAVFARKL